MPQGPGGRLYLFQVGVLASAKALWQEWPGVCEELLESWCGRSG